MWVSDTQSSQRHEPAALPEGERLHIELEVIDVAESHEHLHCTLLGVMELEVEKKEQHGVSRRGTTYERAALPVPSTKLGDLYPIPYTLEAVGHSWWWA